MSPGWVLLSGLALFYGIIWFFDSFFKSCMHYPYYAFLEGTGLKIGLFNFSWKTTAFNRLIFRLSKRGSWFLKKWYTFGYLFSVIVFLPFAVWVLASTITSSIIVHGSSHEGSFKVETILPGVNLPTGDLWAYFVALAISSIVHELGHAVAAVQEDVQLLTVGFYVFVFIPIAFVELNTDHLNVLSVSRRLRIYCAGVWHNIVCGIVMIILYSSVVHLFNFGYHVGSGVKVTGFRPNSPLVGDRGLDVGDQITEINKCQVKENSDWHFCLFTTTMEQFGLCVTNDFVSRYDEIGAIEYKKNDLLDCCLGASDQSLCFEYIEPTYGDVTLVGQYFCLKPRDIIKEQFVKCMNTHPNICPSNQHCLKPLLGNKTNLFIINRHEKDTVLYIGSPNDLSSTVQIDHFIPRHKVFSIFSPQQLEKMLEYIFMFSFGIAIINIIPCFWTDGHHIAANIIQVIAGWWGKDSAFVNALTLCVVLLGTVTTIPSLIYLFFKTVAS